MICPVTEPMYYGPNSFALSEMQKTRKVYLPAGTDWIDFWTGEKHPGGQTVSANADIDVMPIFVRAGALLPMAEPAQHTGAIRKDRMDLQVFPGADCRFTLYQDEGDSYRYESGLYATIDMTWEDATGTLTLHARKGDFPGMPESIVFSLSGLSPAIRTIVYQGHEIILRRE